MNWVGGSRSRWMVKNDARKQKEFFEKKRLQKKIEHLGLAATPQEAARGSLDLVTLFIVNQIAAKKENKNSHKVTHLSPRKGSRWPINEDALELPMSPCSPSQISLMESQPQYSIQRKRKHNLSEWHSNRQLSPVLESNLSDGSASDYRHVISDTFSPLSSAASGSLNGTLPVGQRGEFKSFCQPREVRVASPWSGMLHGSHYPPVSRVQFGSTESSVISTQKSTGHTLKTTECFFSLSKDDKDQETGLEDFDCGEYSSEETTFDNRKIRIGFQEASLQNSMLIGHPKESQSRYQEPDFLSQPVESVACGAHGQGSLRSCGSVCSSPCEGLFSSSSDSVGSRGGEGDQFVPSRVQPATAHRREPWAGQEGWPSRRRETGTQTDSIAPRRTSDASTQCSPRREGEPSTHPSAGFRSYSRRVWHEKYDQASRGQHVSVNELLEIDSLSGTPNSIREEGLLPQSKSRVAALQDTRVAVTGIQLHPGGPENLHRPKTIPENGRLSTPALKHVNMNKTQVRDELRKEQTHGGQRQGEQVENCDPTQHPVENMARREGEDLTTESMLMNKVSEETATLQEIADILLMMKQNNKV